MAATMTRQQVLDELGYLATVEHALCVDYLLLHYALRTVVKAAPEVAGAVEEALSLAQNAEMHHLARVNRALVEAGRAPVVERASHVVDASGSAVAVGPLSPVRFAGSPGHQAALAAAVDTRYARIGEAVAASGDVLDPDGQLSFLLDSVGGHAGRVERLARSLAGVDLSELLGDLRLDPANALERDLLALSDRYYATVVANVGAGLAHDHVLAGELLSVATTAMDLLHRVNAPLVERGLVPSFSLGSG